MFATMVSARRVSVLLAWAIAAAGAALPRAAGAARLQDARADTPARRAAAFLQRLQAGTGTPGVSGAVALHGVVVFEFGAGLIDLEHRVPARGNSVYNIGSVSKIVTAVAVMQLVERGRVSLDDDIRKYVPEFPDKGVTITLRHLLTHTSGIRHYHDGDFPGTPDNENIDPQFGYGEGLRLFARDSLLFRPGTAVFYTSYGVNLLQAVVERASGESFASYLRRNIWEPAGMASAGVDDPAVVVPHRALSYRFDQGRALNYYYNDLRYKYASGGMIGSATDLVRFGASVNAGTLVSERTRDRMFTDQTAGLPAFHEGAAPTEQERGQGLLWWLRKDSAGRRVAYHCGSVKAFNACMVDFIDEDLVAAVMTNSWECCGWSKADSLAAFFRPIRSR
jgi:serine beta-lactamase-like protein LACTB, mitochondrial